MRHRDLLASIALATAGLAGPAHAGTITLTCPDAAVVSNGPNYTIICSGPAVPKIPDPTPAPTPTPTPAPPPVVGACPAPPPGMVTGDLGLEGATQRPQLGSGQVISFPRPTALPAGTMLGVVRAGETTATPAKSFFEMHISKCRGEIRSTAGNCYVGTYTQNLIEMYWFFRLQGITANDAQAMGGCVATDPGPWYVNARWTYPVQPAWGYGSYVFQWQGGGM